MPTESRTHTIESASEVHRPASGNSDDRPTKSPGKKRRSTPYPHLFRLLHWLISAALIFSVVTGLSLHASAEPYWSMFRGRVADWMLQGRVTWLHLLSAGVFVPSVIAVAIIYFRFARAIPKGRRRITHVLLVVGGLAMVATAPLLMRPVGPNWVYFVARAIHGFTGLILLPAALLWHVIDGVTAYWKLLIPAFHPTRAPRWGSLALFVVLATATTWSLYGEMPWTTAGKTLVAARIDIASETIDDLSALPWEDAAPLAIELANGVGFEGGRTEVVLKALHNGDELFVLAEWKDRTLNRTYLPWKKTPDGWQHLATDTKDESVFYEDKFSLIFPIEHDPEFERFGCAAYCHVGGGRAFGYKGSDVPVDVWHWKSVRSDPLGQVDDKYWAEVDFEAEDVGRHGDPKEDGTGYSKNYTADVDHPLWLPRDESFVELGRIIREGAVEYSEEAAAAIPAGTIVPGIVSNPFVGDRGDVRCTSEHLGDRWRLYIRRKLDTGSEHDVRFEPGKTYGFAAAAFDQTSKRHAYNLTTYHLHLAP
ncbi:MAG: hypothetical protein D6741_09350 [Planctomycetota bacterium]|nr:MAG: hypothetical protein D6741_09350 [Planctomycetota bacterium]